MKRLLVIGFELEAKYVEQIREQAPEFEVMECLNREKLAEYADRTEILFSYYASKEFFQQAKELRWIHSVSAGVNQWMVPDVLESNIILTNSSGIHGISISELILAQMLGFATGMHTLIRAQMAKDAEARSKVNQTKFELDGQTVGVVGLGSIGDTLAYKAKGLGMRVLALKRNPVEKPPYVDELYGPEQLPELLRQADHVALCLPLTAETKHMIGERELAIMKPTSYIYNIGRGATIDQDALIKALQDGRIAGAGLDVTTPDPPAPESPLWEMSNVMLSLHTSGNSPENDMRVTDLFLKNLRRYVNGMPLLNIVSKELEY